MALQHPYVEKTVVDGVNDVEAIDHNKQEDQISELTDIAYRRDNQIIVAVQPMEFAGGSVIDLLTKRVVDFPAKTIRVRVGASGLVSLSTTNGPGPVGTGIPTNIQRFTTQSLLAMGCLTGPGQKTGVRIVVYEDLKEVGWFDAIVVAP